MLKTLMHPSLDELHDFASGTPVDQSPQTRARVAAHLERCARCRESVQDLRAIANSVAGIAFEEPPAGLRERILAAREQGARAILPAEDVGARSPLIRRIAVAAAAALTLMAGSLFVRTRGVEAGAPTGVLQLTPAAPTRGQRISVRYEPAASLQRHSWLVLRARMWSPNGRSYELGVPVVSAARLERERGGTFVGSFTLPDSVVFAALAVEDSAAAVIDDGGRGWDLLVSRQDGTPLYEALEQRTHDLMGRNWEEGFATVRRMVTLYPNDLRAWNWLQSFQSWLGRGKDDSVLALHRAKLAEFDAMLSRGQLASGENLGLLAWYARPLDSARFARFKKRLMREEPTNSFAIQWRLLDALDSLRTSKDTARALSALEILWREAPAERLEQIAPVSFDIAVESGNSALAGVWADRMIAAQRDHDGAAGYVASRMSSAPATRDEGMRRLRGQLADLAELRSAERKLGETISSQRERHDASKRNALAALGRALVATGRNAAGLDTLALASATGWDLGVFRSVRQASIAAGDRQRALTMLARIAVDPTTDSAFVDSANTIGTRELGADHWSARLDTARGVFAERTLSKAGTRSLPGDPELRDVQGKAHTLRDLANGHVTVVGFWSRFCGPAVDDLPRMNAVAERLAREGVRVVSIVEEAAPSPELEAFLREKHVTMSIYFDTKHEASRAFNQWATPDYFILDAEGRIRFDVSNSAREVLARAEALRLEGQKIAAR